MQYEDIVKDALSRFGDAIASGYMGRVAIQNEYEVSESVARRINSEVSRLFQNPEKLIEREPDVEKSEWLYDKKYYYNEDTDSYITFISSSPKPVVTPGHIHRAMKRAYSNWDGNPATINEIARQFSFPRPWFVEYKRIHEWTHDSEPFSSEEIVSRDIDEMIEDALQMKRQALYERYERKEWDTIREEAAKFREFDRYVQQPLIQLITDTLPKYSPPQATRLRTDLGAVAAVISPFDLHYGKYGWEDEVRRGYSREEAERLLMEKTAGLLEVIQRWNVEKIYVGIGSDFMHIDNYQGTTTSGTPQDTDGTIAQIIVEGSMLAAKCLDMLRQVAPLEVFCVTGNHDVAQSVNMAMFMYAWYKEADDVTVHMDFKPRQYTTYGDNLLVFAHGDKPRDHKELARKVPLEAPRDMWGQTKHAMVFVGDLHFKRVEDFDGIHMLQMPSLSGDDRWHERNGYNTNTRAMAGYVIDPLKGLVADIYDPVV